MCTREVSFCEFQGLYQTSNSATVMQIGASFKLRRYSVKDIMTKISGIRQMLSCRCKLAFFQAMEKLLIKDRQARNKPALMQITWLKDKISGITIDKTVSDQMMARRNTLPAYWTTQMFGDYIISLQDAHLEICGYSKRHFPNISFAPKDPQPSCVISSIPPPLFAFYVSQVCIHTSIDSFFRNLTLVFFLCTV